MSTELCQQRSARHRLAAVLVAMCAAVAVTSCGAQSSGTADTQPQGSTPPTQAAPASESGAPERIAVTVPGTLAADFAELSQRASGSIGLAIMPVGGHNMVSLGEWTTGPAWSTIKIPLAIAALRADQAGATYSVSSAITASDNSAAEALWQALGSPQQAAQKIEAVLREGEDANTTVPTTRSRGEYSIYGQTQWSLADQVHFASRLPCLAQGDTVVNLMQQVVSNQQWGLGSVFSGAGYKGGWGPDTSGEYLVRQVGLVPVADGGYIAVAFAAKPDSGTFSAGMAMLDNMATLVSQHLSEFTGGQCPT